ncbi:helix-turn-helix transcriptional regulator [Zhihengliuella salsuginis]|uniref:LuxR family transcriptional regulator n=1 Tax=Zhihengliuella salsuginis TaxID=578222 RepID=A0ABQ3GGK0_9MICC|nr:LuxR family transcriptional regulator [Zhihengliuella salsuginis]GHD05165.1 LuxR family transcriptional regulator [Zhihengliuella salsuginis]
MTAPEGQDSAEDPRGTPPARRSAPAAGRDSPLPAGDAADRGPFVGRGGEVRTLARALEDAGRGHPRVLLVRGGTGAGKTRLVGQFLDEQRLRTGAPGGGPFADGEPSLHYVTGTSWERAVPGGVVGQLRSSLGPLDPAAEPVPGIPGGELLDDLGRAGRERPRVVVVDNFHAVDDDSMRALLYVVRRLAGLRVLLLLIVRDSALHRLPGPCRDLLEDRHIHQLPVGALTTAEIMELAAAREGIGLSEPIAHRLAGYCGGNLRHLLHLLEEQPTAFWRQWHRDMPAPRALVYDAVERLEGLEPPARGFVESAAVLGRRARLADVVGLSACDDPLAVLAILTGDGLLSVSGDSGDLSTEFASEVERAAYYRSLGFSRRIELHRRAADVVSDEGSALDHLAAAALLPDAELAERLRAYAARQADVGAWSVAANALFTAGRLTPEGASHQHLLLQAVDAMVGAGELPRALTYVDEINQYAPGPERNAVTGYMAILQGRQQEADMLLTQAWTLAGRDGARQTRALIAQRRVLDSLVRWDGESLVTWAGRAQEAAEPDSPAAIEAVAIRGLGLGALGRKEEAEAQYRHLLSRDDLGAQGQRVRMGSGWLHLAMDQFETAREELSSAVSTDFSYGSFRISLWASAWLARAEFGLGNWTAALGVVERAHVLCTSTGVDLVRPLLHWTSAQIHALRGEMEQAERHLHLGQSTAGDYLIMQLPYAISKAQIAEARADYEGVLRALEPVLGRRALTSEPGFWPWPDLYANALVMTDRLEEACAFLDEFEQLADLRSHRTSRAKLHAVRGRVLGAQSDIEAAREEFESALAGLDGLDLPYDRARIEFAYGQTLRRAGKRRDSAVPLHRAREGFAGLGAGNSVERCDRELQAAGLVSERGEKQRDGATDWSVLTGQEAAVVRLVATGATNKQAGQELFVSVKTVQYHLTRIYAKLGVASRTELAARYREDGTGV